MQLVGTVTCGTPVLAEENVSTLIPVSTGLAKGAQNIFLLHAVGDSNGITQELLAVICF